MRKLASIQRISAIRPIEGADKIEVADVLGWSVVVKKGDFKEGDLAVYFEIDSWLDASNPAFASFEDRFTNWGTKRGMRLKTIKLRKQVSQGLLMPIGDFNELMELPDQAFEIGTDVTEILKIEKWEPADEASSNAGGQKAAVTRPFPWFLRKTDQERVQNMVQELGKHWNDDFEVTIKLDGSSMTVYAISNESKVYDEVYAEWEARSLKRKTRLQRLVHDVKKFFGLVKKPEVLFGVCSRNIELDPNGDDHFSTYCREHGVFATVEHVVKNTGTKAIAFQGELIAPSIQGNYEQVKGFEWRVFDVFDIEQQTYMKPAQARAYTGIAGLEYVPVLSVEMNLRDFEHEADNGSPEFTRYAIEQILKFAEGPGMNPGVKREGVVFKSNTSGFSFKAISNSYLLKKG